MTYGERLKLARGRLGLSQQALAAKAGTSQANISALERAGVSGSEFTAQIAVACEVNPLWLAAEIGSMDIGYYVLDSDISAALKKLEGLKSYQQEIAKREILNVIEKIVEIGEKLN